MRTSGPARYALLFVTFSIVSACSSDPTAEDILKDPELAQKINRECAVKGMRGEDTDTAACNALQEAIAMEWDNAMRNLKSEMDKIQR